MAKNRNFTVELRRKRESKTNYKKRLNLISSSTFRLVIRPSLKNILVQIVQFDPKGDKVLTSASSRELKKVGWNFHSGNIPSAYLTGLLLAKKSKSKFIKELILDAGLKRSVKNSVTYAALKGVVDGGIKVPNNKEILPNEERISGKHIQDYAILLKEKDPEKYKIQFASYIKNNQDPTKIQESFKKIKEGLSK